MSTDIEIMPTRISPFPLDPEPRDLIIFGTSSTPIPDHKPLGLTGSTRKCGYTLIQHPVISYYVLTVRSNWFWLQFNIYRSKSCGIHSFSIERICTILLHHILDVGSKINNWLSILIRWNDNSAPKKLR